LLALAEDPAGLNDAKKRSRVSRTPAPRGSEREPPIVIVTSAEMFASGLAQIERHDPTAIQAQAGAA
jgi:hypothetical protein